MYDVSIYLAAGIGLHIEQSLDVSERNLLHQNNTSDRALVQAERINSGLNPDQRGTKFADTGFQGAREVADSLTWTNNGLVNNRRARALRLIPPDVFGAAPRTRITFKVHYHGITLETFEGCASALWRVEAMQRGLPSFLF